ncbi:sulfotransferase family protein [Streptomyces sp. NBC_01022]|uniref:sulfotransferase family protein n=1 Tax=Streptomyces sp. NBC_01022 TaxID=2903723 RepID=UPI002DD85A5C|nr:sulfotransferase [Streptomyces sp. NBC_01022]WRZ82588.1 sulfotransferase [Streptomyces sp. NBC_01022]
MLKNPSHVFAIDEIMRVYPDALIIRTHRAPRTAMASTCSLAEQGKHDMSDAYDRETIGRTQLALWSRGIEHFETARRRYDPRQFLDVDYQDFVTDPLGTVGGIYDHFGLEFTARARGAIEASHRKSLGAHRRPDHRYSLEDFGLSEADVDRAFTARA